MELLGKIVLVVLIVPVLLDDAPPEINCMDTWYGAYAQTAEITCVARAQASSPIEDAYVSFYRNGDEMPQNLVNMSDREWLSTKKFTVIKDKSSSNLTLHFVPVYLQDFRNYTFVAHNSVGSSEKRVTLEQDPDSKLYNSATWVRPATIVAFFAALSALLWH